MRFRPQITGLRPLQIKKRLNSGTPGHGPHRPVLNPPRRLGKRVGGDRSLGQLRGFFSGAVPVLLVGVPRDLEEVTIGIGEVPGVDAERAHMSGLGQRASGGFDVPEQLVDLCL
jgi:hypothetical protein